MGVGVSLNPYFASEIRTSGYDRRCNLTIHSKNFCDNSKDPRVESRSKGVRPVKSSSRSKRLEDPRIRGPTRGALSLLGL